MFEYTCIVKDNKDPKSDWGAFTNRAIASIMRDRLAEKFSGIEFFIENIV